MRELSRSSGAGAYLSTSIVIYDPAIIKGYYEGPEGVEPDGEDTNLWRTAGMEHIIA